MGSTSEIVTILPGATFYGSLARLLAAPLAPPQAVAYRLGPPSGRPSVSIAPPAGQDRSVGPSHWLMTDYFLESS